MDQQLAARVGDEAAQLMSRYRLLVWGSRGLNFLGIFLIFVVFLAVTSISKYILIAYLIYLPLDVAFLVVCVIQGRKAARAAELSAGAFVSRASGRSIKQVSRVLMRRPLTGLDSFLLDLHAWPTQPPTGSSMAGVIPREKATPYPTNYTGAIVGCSIILLGVVGIIPATVLTITRTVVGPAAGLMTIACVACILIGAIVGYSSIARQARARIAWNSTKREQS